jgi:mono/diheme cytochrome c family protein
MKPAKTLLVLAGLTAGTLCSANAPALWEKHCATCHGPDGKGVTMMGKKLKIKDLTDPEFQAAFTDADAAKAIREGIKSEDGKTRMKPIEGVTDEDIRVLVAHVRGLVKK